jgi:hypothetical protein
MRSLVIMAASIALMAAPAFASDLSGGFNGHTSTSAYSNGATAAAPEYAFADAGETASVDTVNTYGQGGGTDVTSSFSAGSDAGAYGKLNGASATSSTSDWGGYSDNTSSGHFPGW